jgi:predicted acetyltransferase
MLRLVKPGREYEEEILAFKREMEEAGNGDMEGCGGLNRVDSFDEWMEHLNAYADRNKIDPGTGYVEGSQYLLVEEDSHRILGMINLRHYLNDQLMRTSGHIGFSIRPGERRKGYGKTQLRQALEIIGRRA